WCGRFFTVCMYAVHRMAASFPTRRSSDLFAILDAGRARRFARPAVEAQVEMVMNLVIQLQAAVSDGRLELNDEVHHHLDLCLDCRAGETACPSGVQYGKQIGRATCREGGRHPVYGVHADGKETSAP